MLFIIASWRKKPPLELLEVVLLRYVAHEKKKQKTGYTGAIDTVKGHLRQCKLPHIFLSRQDSGAASLTR